LQRKIDKAKEQISRTVALQERLDKLEKWASSWPVKMMPTLRLSRETEGLRRENDELRRGRDRADRSSFHAAGSGSRVGNGFMSGLALEILPEDEEALFGDFGASRQNGGAEVDDALASLQRKRRRTEVPRPYVLVSVHNINSFLASLIAPVSYPPLSVSPLPHALSPLKRPSSRTPVAD
jgi:hypothetical protein